MPNFRYDQRFDSEPCSVLAVGQTEDDDTVSDAANASVAILVM
ncbi:MAG: hypothetical protein ACOCR6_02095 [archaeon]